MACLSLLLLSYQVAFGSSGPGLNAAEPERTHPRKDHLIGTFSRTEPGGESQAQQLTQGIEVVAFSVNHVPGTGAIIIA